MQLYVSSTKRKALAGLTAAGEVPSSTQELLTTNHLATSLHAVHSRDATFKRMHRLLRKYRQRYTTVIAFVPSSGSAGASSGRQHPGSAAAGAATELLESTRQQKGPLIIYSLPYSQDTQS